MTELAPHSLDPETLREVYPDPAAVRGRIEELRREIRERTGRDRRAARPR